MKKEDKHLFKNKFNLPSLLNRLIDEKQQWLTTVRNATAALNMVEEVYEQTTTIEQLIQQQSFCYNKRNNNNKNNNKLFH